MRDCSEADGADGDGVMKVDTTRIKSLQAATLRAVLQIKVGRVAQLCKDLHENRGAVYVMGNGGSQANAAHLVLHLRQTGIPAFDLLADTAWLTAEANDMGYHGAPGRSYSTGLFMPGMLVLFSGSGNSQNCVDMAKKWQGYQGIKVWAFLGMNGGRLKDLADDVIHIPSMEYGAIEAGHDAALHMVAAGIGAPIFGPMSDT